jgi:predicted transcriptional regulator
MNALTFKQTIETGVQAGLIIKDTKSGKYLLTAEGWKQ